ncbi:MAG: hypothetical protein ACRERC_07280 [Candidatus Binatia bacterium]
MSIILRIAALYSLAWAVFLVMPGWLPFDPGSGTPPGRALACALAIANLGYALLFWRAAADPQRERVIVYAALLVLALRAAAGTYEVLYSLDGPVAVVRMVDMVICLAGFVGLLNALPAVVQNDGGG